MRIRCIHIYSHNQVLAPTSDNKMASKLEVEKVPLHVPSLEDTAEVLQRGLIKHFSEVQVKVVECPDLRQSPFELVAPGIGGKPRILDIGGVPYLVPKVQLDKVYNIDNIASLVDFPGAFLIGAGAGPHKAVGVNSEMVANIRAKGGEQKPTNGTYISYINAKDQSCKLCQVHGNSRDFALMANLLASEGKTGKVLEVKVRTRTSDLSFVDAVRSELGLHFGDKSVGIGGAFALLKGKAHMHVMPDFSENPLDSDADVNNWLRFYDMSTPMICVGVCFSHDPGLDLRIEHFHGFNHNGEGGHYHYDVTPDEAEYLAYFNLAEYVYRIDRPKK